MKSLASTALLGLVAIGVAEPAAAAAAAEQTPRSSSPAAAVTGPAPVGPLFSTAPAYVRTAPADPAAVALQLTFGLPVQWLSPPAIRAAPGQPVLVRIKRTDPGSRSAATTPSPVPAPAAAAPRPATTPTATSPAEVRRAVVSTAPSAAGSPPTPVASSSPQPTAVTQPAPTPPAPPVGAAATAAGAAPTMPAASSPPPSPAPATPPSLPAAQEPARAIRTSGPATVIPSPSATPSPTATPAVNGDAGNPFLGAVGWIDPNSPARRDADARRSYDPAGARALDRIAGAPVADWYGDWVPTGDLARIVRDRVATQTAAGALPVIVTYAIPGRDCGQHSAGGAGSPQAYRDWIEQLATGIGEHRAVVVVEPDGLAQLDCLSPERAAERTALIRDAAARLERGPNTTVYLDGGTVGWKSAEEMANRLRAAGVDQTRGFSINVSNFATTAASIAYGDDISARLGGIPHYVIDTSRNGRGPGDTWCNPSGRALGTPMTTQTGSTSADALTWVKRAGESDGTCNGGPPAGQWWSQHAIALAQNTP